MPPAATPISGNVWRASKREDRGAAARALRGLALSVGLMAGFVWLPAPATAGPPIEDHWLWVAPTPVDGDVLPPPGSANQTGPVLRDPRLDSFGSEMGFGGPQDDVIRMTPRNIPTIGGKGNLKSPAPLIYSTKPEPKPLPADAIRGGDYTTPSRPGMMAPAGQGNLPVREAMPMPAQIPTQTADPFNWQPRTPSTAGNPSAVVSPNGRSGGAMQGGQASGATQLYIMPGSANAAYGVNDSAGAALQQPTVFDMQPRQNRLNEASNVEPTQLPTEALVAPRVVIPAPVTAAPTAAIPAALPAVVALPAPPEALARPAAGGSAPLMIGTVIPGSVSGVGAPVKTLPTLPPPLPIETAPAAAPTPVPNPTPVTAPAPAPQATPQATPHVALPSLPKPLTTPATAPSTAPAAATASPPAPEPAPTPQATPPVALPSLPKPMTTPSTAPSTAPAAATATPPAPEPAPAPQATPPVPTAKIAPVEAPVPATAPAALVPPQPEPPSPSMLKLPGSKVPVYPYGQGPRTQDQAAVPVLARPAASAPATTPAAAVTAAPVSALPPVQPASAPAATAAPVPSVMPAVPPAAPASTVRYDRFP